MLKGDKDGEFIYTGCRENIVIDYVMGDELVRKSIERVVVGDKVDSGGVVDERGGEGEKKYRGSKRVREVGEREGGSGKREGGGQT